MIRFGRCCLLAVLATASLLMCATSARAQVTFTSPGNGDTVFSVPITITGTQSPTATAVFLEIVQDPAAPVPPAGTGGASRQIGTVNPSDPIHLTSPTTWEATLNLLNGTYRLTVFSDADAPASIDVTVTAAGNPTG